jgi:hypothetical protein
MMPMASMKVSSARDPDHNAIRKPMEMTSARTRESTEEMVGAMMVSTAL